MKQIKLTQNKYALIDDEDFSYINQFNWYYNKGYAYRWNRLDSNKRIRISMHREIIDVPDNYKTDHINGITLDNRKVNLRICTIGENNKNASLRKDNKSGYKGVCWIPKYQKFVAQIRVNKKLIRLGLFDDKIEAAKVYNNAALKYFKNFAKLNKIEDKK